ncbi:GIY-YIG nuclease family protein [Streptomyces phaeochromogenes]|uniref:GIY-YIG nuclease family protein n=1 Tax=Streptomyces phaeochromogenes TaxID=1923 RepID=UPI00368E634E
MTTRTLTKGQISVLATAAVVMVAVGVAGAIGTFSNALAEFGREATAAGVVAAGEGLTLILALTMLGLTLLGQSSPVWVRVGLWLAPLAACGTGLSLADTLTEAVVYSTMPLGMSGAAEGLGLIARRVVIYTTGTDAEAQRRNADSVQQLAYHQAAADRHPDKDTREASLRKSWDIAKKVGVGDQVLGAALVEVQRKRITGGADAALGGMYGAEPAIEPPAQPRTFNATEKLRVQFATMDPADAIRLAADARPDAAPADLAHILGTYGVPVDAVAVAMVLGQETGEEEGPEEDVWAIRAARPEDGLDARARRLEDRREAMAQSMAGLARIEYSAVPEGRHAPVVYFLRNGERVKIGTSTNLRQRILALALRRQDLLLVVEGDHETERAFHDQFAKQRVAFTEWFHLAGGLARWLATARRDLPEVPWTLDDHSPDTEVTIERAGSDHPAAPGAAPELVIPTVGELAAPFRWEDIVNPDGASKVTAALPAEQPRQVVTEVVTLTPSDLRRMARALNRRVVTATGKPVTIDRLREEFGLSRREATDLRREILGDRS